MKFCIQCKSRFEQSGWACISCGFAPEKRGKIPFFAPALAAWSENFPANLFDALARLESAHFWFRARNELIAWAMKKYFSNARSFFEVGCGNAFVLSRLEREFPSLVMAGSDLHDAGLSHAAARLQRSELIQMDARTIPYAEEFDVIGAFDVIEHIQEDGDVLEQFAQALRPGGGLILTVPQHRILWSSFDEASSHVRRYSAGELRSKVEAAGFKVVRMSSFVSLLFPVLLIVRILKRKSRSEEHDFLGELTLSPWMNGVLEKIMSIERYLIKSGVNFPFGGSLFVVARKVGVASVG